jgi:hypothetical protein
MLGFLGVFLARNPPVAQNGATPETANGVLPLHQAHPGNAEDMPDDRTIDGLFQYASQYYVAGRYGVFASLIPVAGNLHHHAIEMFLKGALSKSMSPDDMRKKLGHKLDQCWNVFKQQVGDTSLGRFDRIIEELNKFEEVRYPDELMKRGASMVFNITKAGAAMTSIRGVSEPNYSLCLEDLDELVAEIFKIASRNPSVYLKMMIRKDALEYLERDNAFFK